MANDPAWQVNVGIDVGKARLDVHIHERGIALSAPNDPPCMRKLPSRPKRYQLE